MRFGWALRYTRFATAPMWLIIYFRTMRGLLRIARLKRTPIARIRWVFVLAWMGLIFYLSSRSDLPTPNGLSAEVEAILGHLTVYAVLAVLIAYALADSGISTVRRLISAFVFAVLYGVSDELHQSFVPGRDPDIFDLMVDGIGAFIGLIAWILLQNWRNPKQFSLKQST
jgi:VanZ family protein